MNTVKTERFVVEISVHCTTGYILYIAGLGFTSGPFLVVFVGEERHCDRFLAEFFGLNLSVSFYQSSVLSQVPVDPI